MEKSKNEFEVLKNGEIDLVALIKLIFFSKGLILKYFIGFVFFGLIMAILSKNQFTATTSFIPKVGEQGKVNSNLGGLASLAGIDLNSQSSGSSIPISMYPKIVESVPFKSRLMPTMITLENGSEMTLEEYLENRPLDISSLIKKYTIGLPSQFFNAISSKTSNENIDSIVYGIDLIEISNERFQLYELLGTMISVQSSEQEGYISLKVEDFSRTVAAQIARQADKILQELIIDYQIGSTRMNYEFIEKQYLMKQNEFNQLQDSLARFNDSNQNINSAYFRNQISRMEFRLNVVGQVYSDLASQKEQTLIKLQRDTPVFMVVEPVVIPNEPTSPKRLIMILSYAIFGLFISVVFILSKQFFRFIRAELIKS